jgi:hypothetical protein
MERWLEGQRRRFALACDYHHVIFTVPHELNPIWRFNRSLVGNLVFRAASESLLTLLEDSSNLGGLPGLVMTLHTWGRSAIEHLHVHALVTAGGWTAKGWVSCRPRFFVDFTELRQLYRKKLVRSLRRSLERRILVLPPDIERTAFLRELDHLEGCQWHVRVMDRYRGGEGVLTYFSRYARGGPVANHQLLSYDGREVHFRYRAHKTGKQEVARMRGAQFLRRLLEHIPEKNFRLLRYYGLFAPSHRKQLAQVRRWLGMPPHRTPVKLTLEAYLARFQIEPLTHCPICGEPLIRCEIPPLTEGVPRASPREVVHAA